MEGYTPPPGQELQTDFRIAGANYFRTMKIPLKNGRFFTEDDTLDKAPVAIIDENSRNASGRKAIPLENMCGLIPKSQSRLWVWLARSNNTV